MTPQRQIQPAPDNLRMQLDGAGTAMMMTTMNTVPRCTLDQLLDRLKPGMTVYVPGVSGESLPFYEALKARPEAAAGVRFVGMHFPGINRNDYLGLHPEARQRNYVMSQGLRAGLADGRAELLPLDHPSSYRDLLENVEIDLALAQLTPPDASGSCSLGLAYDFLPAVWAKAKVRMAHFNPRLPRTQGSFSVRACDIDAAFEMDADLLPYDAGQPDDGLRAHALRVAELVRDGDTLEFGIGKLQTGILDALRGHRGLKVWSGMVSPALIGLLDAGAVQGRGSVDAGVALGDADFYRRIDGDDSFFFRPVAETHNALRIGQIPNFCAINSAVEVDLFGQVNADSLKGRLLAGVGGLPPFVTGALLSPGGRSIIALSSATDDGRFTRIVPTLGAPGLAALPRHCADYVVTEHGTAALRGLDVHGRAKALIAIAAPGHREALEKAWAEMAARL